MKLMRDKRINHGAKNLYPYLVVFCKKKDYCWASNEELAEIVGCSVSTFQRRVKSLVDHGYAFITQENTPYQKNGKLRWKESRKIFIDKNKFKKFAGRSKVTTSNGQVKSDLQSSDIPKGISSESKKKQERAAPCSKIVHNSENLTPNQRVAYEKILAMNLKNHKGESFNEKTALDLCRSHPLDRVENFIEAFRQRADRYRRQGREMTNCAGTFLQICRQNIEATPPGVEFGREVFRQWQRQNNFYEFQENGNFVIIPNMPGTEIPLFMRGQELIRRLDEKMEAVERTKLHAGCY